MKKIKIFYSITALLFLTLIISCSPEDSAEIEESDLSAIEETTLTFHYQGKQFVINVTSDANGDFIFPETLPSEIEQLETVENLATVVSGNQIYFFDNQEASAEFFGYARKDILFGGQLSSGRPPFSVSRFNRDVRAYEHDFFNGRKLNITRGHQLRNLTSIGFNDVMSSIAIDTQYQNPFVGDIVILYEHKDFRGRSLSFTCELETRDCLFISGNSNNLIPSQTYRGNAKFRNIHFKLFRRWADKVSSIDVRFGGVSAVPPYPSSGGGGTGGGGGGGDPIGDLPIK